MVWILKKAASIEATSGDNLLVSSEIENKLPNKQKLICSPLMKRAMTSPLSSVKLVYIIALSIFEDNNLCMIRTRINHYNLHLHINIQCHAVLYRIPHSHAKPVQ